MKTHLRTHLWLIIAESSGGQTLSGVLFHDSVCRQVTEGLEGANRRLRPRSEYPIHVQPNPDESVQRELQIADLSTNHPSPYHRHPPRMVNRSASRKDGVEAAHLDMPAEA
jgi:hypothetical protein